MSSALVDAVTPLLHRLAAKLVKTIHWFGTDALRARVVVDVELLAAWFVSLLAKSTNENGMKKAAASIQKCYRCWKHRRCIQRKWRKQIVSHTGQVSVVYVNKLTGCTRCSKPTEFGRADLKRMEEEEHALRRFKKNIYTLADRAPLAEMIAAPQARGLRQGGLPTTKHLDKAVLADAADDKENSCIADNKAVIACKRLSKAVSGLRPSLRPLRPLTRHNNSKLAKRSAKPSAVDGNDASFGCNSNSQAKDTRNPMWAGIHTSMT